MTNQHPITPPPQLMEAWSREVNLNEPTFAQVATIAARWGADQELEACCEWFADDVVSEVFSIVAELRNARRPKPSTDKELALRELVDVYDKAEIDDITYKTIRRALEQLDE